MEVNLGNEGVEIPGVWNEGNLQINWAQHGSPY